jgi:flagellar motor switch/type III secretory pathway protein FliN
VNATPYLLPGRAITTGLAQRALAALESWARGWAALPDHAVTCGDACEAAPAALDTAWQRRTLAAGLEVFVALPWDGQHWMEQLVFGLDDGTPASPLAGGVAAAALEALAAQLVDALTSQASTPAERAAPAPALLRRGAGTILCTIQLGARTLRVLVPAGAYATPARKARAGEPVVPLRQALAALPVPLTVELCRAELTLGYLRTLALGDVLALPMALDAPLHVHGPDAAPLCAAHLGTIDGRRAVELTGHTGAAGASNEPRNSP